MLLQFYQGGKYRDVATCNKNTSTHIDVKNLNLDSIDLLAHVSVTEKVWINCAGTKF